MPKSTHFACTESDLHAGTSDFEGILIVPCNEIQPNNESDASHEGHYHSLTHSFIHQWSSSSFCMRRTFTLAEKIVELLGCVTCIYTDWATHYKDTTPD